MEFLCDGLWQNTHKAGKADQIRRAFFNDIADILYSTAYNRGYA